MKWTGRLSIVVLIIAFIAIILPLIGKLSGEVFGEKWVRHGYIGDYYGAGFVCCVVLIAAFAILFFIIRWIIHG